MDDLLDGLDSPKKKTKKKTEKKSLKLMERKESKKRDKAKVVVNKGVFMDGDSGEDAVTVSTFNKEMKEKESLDFDMDRSRRIGNRTLVFSQNLWKEEGLPDDAKRITIKYMSDAYFELIKKRTDLARFVSIGEQIEINAGDGIILVISSDKGIEKADHKDLKALLNK